MSDPSDFRQTGGPRHQLAVDADGHVRVVAHGDLIGDRRDLPLSEIRRWLYWASKGLPVGEYQAVKALLAHDYKFDAAAAALGVCEQTVRNRLNRALARFRLRVVRAGLPPSWDKYLKGRPSRPGASAAVFACYDQLTEEKRHGFQRSLGNVLARMGTDAVAHHRGQVGGAPASAGRHAVSPDRARRN